MRLSVFTVTYIWKVDLDEKNISQRLHSRCVCPVPCALPCHVACYQAPHRRVPGDQVPGTKGYGMTWIVVCVSLLSTSIYLSPVCSIPMVGWAVLFLIVMRYVRMYEAYTIRDGLNWSASAPSFRINHQEKTDRTTTAAEGQRAAQPAAEGSRRSRIALFITDGCIFKIIRIFVARYEYEILVHDGNYKGGSLGPFFFFQNNKNGIVSGATNNPSNQVINMMLL